MIQLTEVAANQIKKLRDESHGPDTALRVAVVGGGCSGLSYKLDFEKEPKPEDRTFEVMGVKIIVDPKSYLFLKGLTLDYSGGLNGTGFSFQNPNATKNCGCGTSFSV